MKIITFKCSETGIGASPESGGLNQANIAIHRSIIENIFKLLIINLLYA